MQITFQFIGQRLRKLLLKPLIMLFAVIGSIVYLHYDTHQQLNRLAHYIAQSLRLMKVSYEAFYLSPNGSIAFHKLRAYHPSVKSDNIDQNAIRDNKKVTASNYEELFSFDSFVIINSNLFALLNLNNNLRYHTWPKSLHIEATTVYTHWLRSLETWLTQQSIYNFTNLLTRCGINESSENASYASYLALENPLTQVQIQYNFSEIHNLLAISATIKLDDLLSLNATIHFLASPDLFNFNKTATAPLKLVYLKVIYKDQQYNDRIQQWCKKRYNIEKEEFIITKSNQFIKTLQALGMTPSIDIISGYQRHLTAKESLILLTATPIQPIDLRELSTYQSEILWNALQPRMTVNNEQIADLSLAFHEPIVRSKEQFTYLVDRSNSVTSTTKTVMSVEQNNPESLAEPSNAESVNEAVNSALDPIEQLTTHEFDHAAPSPWQTVSSQPQAQSEAPVFNPNTANPNMSIIPSRSSFLSKLHRPGYRPITRYELAKYLDKKVLVQMLNGKEHFGKLTHLEGDTLTLAMELQGGSVVFFIRLDKINEIYVADR